MGLHQPFWRLFPDCTVRRSSARAEAPTPADALDLSVLLMRVWPLAVSCACRGFLRNMPIIGNVLSLEPVRRITDKLITKSRLPV